MSNLEFSIASAGNTAFVGNTITATVYKALNTGDASGLGSPPVFIPTSLTSTVVIAPSTSPSFNANSNLINTVAFAQGDYIAMVIQQSSAGALTFTGVTQIEAGLQFL